MTNLKLTRIDMLPACPNCGSCDVVKNLFSESEQRFRCKRCKAKITLDTCHTAAGVAPSPAPEPVQVDMVNEPPHYKQGKVECLDAIESAIIGLDPFAAVCVAQIIKYTWRHKRKGKTVEDLKKGRFYFDKLIKHYEGEAK